MKTEIKWGIIFAVMSLAWLVLEYALGFHTTKKDSHAMFTNFFAIPAIAIMAMGILAKKKELGGVISFKQALVSGLIISTIVAVLNPVGAFIFHNFINPNFFTDFTQYTVLKGLMTQEKAEMYFNFGNYAMMGAVAALVMGAVTSLVVALIVRNDHKQPAVVSA
ncbi:MAG: DUF4199 domain-containing protein [Bacteroidota bacterium]